MTAARWTREFVMKHPDYKHDSIVTEKINYDLIKACIKITDGEMRCPDLLIDYDTKSNNDIPQATQKIEQHLRLAAKSRKQNGSTSTDALENGLWYILYNVYVILCYVWKLCSYHIAVVYNVMCIHIHTYKYTHTHIHTVRAKPLDITGTIQWYLDAFLLI